MRRAVQLVENGFQQRGTGRKTQSSGRLLRFCLKVAQQLKPGNEESCASPTPELDIQQQVDDPTAAAAVSALLALRCPSDNAMPQDERDCWVKGVGRWRCPMCAKLFHSRGLLTAHKRLHRAAQ